MTNFISAYNRSLEMADALETQKKAIGSVFSDLTTQIKEASDGVINIAIRQRRKEIEAEINPLIPLSVNLNLFAPKKYREYNAIMGEIVITDKNNFSLEIAQWKTSPEGGFPCTLTYPNRDIEVGDEAALASALTDLIESTHTGVIFKALLDKHKKANSPE